MPQGAATTYASKKGSHKILEHASKKGSQIGFPEGDSKKLFLKGFLEAASPERAKNALFGEYNPPLEGAPCCQKY